MEKLRTPWIPKGGVSLDDLLTNKPGDLRGGQTRLEQLYNFIHKRKELGATGPEIREAGIPGAEGILRALLQGQAILRVGVVRTRFVASVFGAPWLLHSFR